VTAYDFAKRLKALKGKTLFQSICDAWKSDPGVFDGIAALMKTWLACASSAMVHAPLALHLPVLNRPDGTVQG
jgi:hypothetical protein